MGLEYIFKNFLINRCKGREILEGSNFLSKISYPPPPPKINWIPLSTQFCTVADQQLDVPPEQKAQGFPNENEAKSRCQRGRQKVYAIRVRQSLSRAVVAACG